LCYCDYFLFVYAFLLVLRI